MTSMKRSYGALSGCNRRPSQWLQLEQQFQAMRIRATGGSTRKASSLTSDRTQGDNAVVAAPEIDIAALMKASMIARHARAVPTTPSYFSRQPFFTDSYLALQKLYRSYKNLPLLPAGHAQRVAWKTIRDHRLALGEHVKATEFVKCLELAKRLHQIHPKLKPQAVEDAVKEYMKEVQPFNNAPPPLPIDKFGRTLGVGKRKSSVARAWVVEGNGEVLINGKTLADAFGRVHDRESAMWALKATARLDKYNVWALVEGGGTTGQAEALTLAIAKALMGHEPALKPALRRAGCITRDPRRVERKKHGHVKARKSPTWVKR
ncbi:hypothetical protein GQ53DRAFT_825983 [Thozetella sp. PMI_491]|nr:hypothetical protein GQ53DRAFT_825983 [Thozetella sp. PMI_491]